MQCLNVMPCSDSSATPVLEEGDELWNITFASS